MAQAPSADFSGVWELVSAENFVEFMKSQGHDDEKVKEMSSGHKSVTLTIEQSGDKSKESITHDNKGKFDIEYTINGDDIDVKNPIGHSMKVNGKWKDDTKQVVIITHNNLITKKIVTVERLMTSKNELVENSVNNDNVSMKKKYKRKE